MAQIQRQLTPYQRYAERFHIVGTRHWWFNNHAILTFDNGKEKWLVLAPRYISPLGGDAGIDFKSPEEIKDLIVDSYISGDYRFKNFIFAFLPKGFAGRLILHGSDPHQTDLCSRVIPTSTYYRVWTWYAPTDDELMRLRLKYTEQKDYFYLDLREDIYGV